MIIRLKIVLIFLFTLSMISCTEVKIKKPNVLFIIVDDLRPELNCYGESKIISPNIDNLAFDGYLFTNSICQVPVCGASRASFLTGLRPTKNRFTKYNTEAEVDAPGIVTLPEHFKKNGYTTISNGKVFHHRYDSKDGWSEEPWWPKVVGRDYLKKTNIEIASKNTKMNGPSYEILDTTDDAYHDGKVIRKSIRDLQRFKNSGESFFLAVGIRKPHLPFTAPKKYWDMYNHDSIKLASNPFIPKDAPKESIHNFGELRNYTDIPAKGKLSDEKARILIHGYCASVTYADKLIGDLLNELKNLELDKNTIVVLMGDHGYQLGEHGLWCKHCNYETSLNAPLIIRIPNMQQGKVVAGLTEYLDLYPTLSDLCNITMPSPLEGVSFVELLKNPLLSIKTTTFSRYKNGETARTSRFGYTEYLDKDGNIISTMLYDHLTDPSENINIVDRKENKMIVEKLSKKLKELRTKK